MYDGHWEPSEAFFMGYRLFFFPPVLNFEHRKRLSTWAKSPSFLQELVQTVLVGSFFRKNFFPVIRPLIEKCILDTTMLFFPTLGLPWMALSTFPWPFSLPCSASNLQIPFSYDRELVDFPTQPPPLVNCASCFFWAKTSILWGTDACGHTEAI